MLKLDTESEPLVLKHSTLPSCKSSSTSLQYQTLLFGCICEGSRSSALC